MSKVQTANPVIGLDRAERQIMGSKPARRLEFSDLRLVVARQELHKVNPDINTA